MPPALTLPASPAAVLIDLAGVLHTGPKALPGAVEALARLRHAGLPLRFLTNTTRTPRATLHAQLQGMGFAITEEEILTAVHATRHVIHQRGLHPHYLVHDDIRAELGPSAPYPDAVVLGDAGPGFSFEALNAAFRLLMAGCPLLAMARNRYFQESDGLTLDLGAFVSALEFGSGQRAEILGKPAPAFFGAALDALGVKAADAVMIGDDVRDDVLGAQASGIAAILVRTGKYRSGDEHAQAEAPCAVANDFAAAVDLLLQR